MATVPPPVGPFLHTERIVNPDGTPTEYFLRQQLSQSGVNASGDATINAVTALENRNINTGTGLEGGGNLSADRTLALSDTAVTPDTYGDANNVPQITVDQQGRITGAQNVAIAGGGGSFQGARLVKTVAQSIPQASTTVITFNSEDFDTNNFHDNVINNERITIPANISFVNVQATIQFASIPNNSNIFLNLFKNATEIVRETDRSFGSTAHSFISSGPIGVVENDFFELRVFLGLASSTTITTNRTYFTVEVLG